MSKQFYSHLIEIETLTVELEQLNLSEEQRVHLAKLIDSNIHNHILDKVLEELPESEKAAFLRYLSEGSHDKIWAHLNSKAENIEEKIKKAADEIKDEMKKDIKEARLK